MGSDLTGYGADNLACHYLGVNYQAAFATDKSSVKDTLRIATETMSSTTNPWLCSLMSGAGRPKMYPVAMSLSQDLLVPHVHPLGKRNGALASQGRLLFHSLQYIVEKLPRVVIIENVRGFTCKGNAYLLAHVKDCLQALHF